MFETKEEKQRKQTRERVKRFRENKKKQAVVAADTVTGNAASVTSTVTASAKMICKCLYFTTINGVLVCAQCGRPAPKTKVEDKIRRGIECK